MLPTVDCPLSTNYQKGIEEKLRLTKKFIVHKKKEYEELQKELVELEKQLSKST